MKNKVTFISEEYLKNNSIVNDNVSMSLIRPNIILAQDMHIQTIIGQKMYEELQTQVKGQSLTPENKLLLEEYVQPAVLWGTLAESTISLLFKITNKNISTKSDGNNNAISKSEADLLKSDFKQKMGWYLARLDEFICHNHQDYPTFKESMYPDVVPNHRPYNNNIYLGSGGRAPKGIRDELEVTGRFGYPVNKTRW